MSCISERRSIEDEVDRNVVVSAPMKRAAAKYCPYVRLKSEGDLRRRVRDSEESPG
jgi:hypothetical protein